MMVALRNALVGNKEEPSAGYWGLCFTAEEAGATIEMGYIGSPPSISLMISTDAVNWTTFTAGLDSITLPKVGSKVWFKAGTTNSKICSSTSAYWQFVITGGKVAASGSIMSLLDGEDGDSMAVQGACFCSLF